MTSTQRSKYHCILIKPSHYDDDGYVIQWARSLIPSNTLAAMYGLALDCAERAILGPDVEILVSAYDETNTRIRVRQIVNKLQQPGVSGLVGFVGVQSNQYPRVMDLAREFRAAGVSVCIGGFHVSGCVAMLPGIQPDLKEAMDLGISLFAGEAEGRLEQLLVDAYGGKMQLLYNFMDDLPNVNNTPTPFLPLDRIRRYISKETSFDAGRGCPFLCSFCTIINVQGRKSRRRSPDDIERIIRVNAKHGIYHYFITDDNFARNRDWELILDRLIHLRESEDLHLKLILQVDTMCHKIPNFIDKAARAGVHKIFIGLESINPETLTLARKTQNRITEYRTMFQAWRAHGILTYAGYILGFPNDTPESIVRDIKIIQRELPVDVLEFFLLTPLPGSEDHQRLYHENVPMDPDMNNYDLIHVTTEHPRMTTQEWKDAYQLAWDTYFSPEHIKTLLYRAKVDGISTKRLANVTLGFYGSHLTEGVHPMESGLFRRKYRRDRRPTLPRESIVRFYSQYLMQTICKFVQVAKLYLRHRRLHLEVEKDPAADQYTDLALTPVTEDELDKYDMFTSTESAKSAVKKSRKRHVANAIISSAR